MRGTTLQHFLFSELGRDIVTGRLQPGHTLVPEQIEHEYGISRTVLREAFKALEARGLIRARHRVGTIVLTQDHWNLLDPQIIAWRNDGPQAREQLRDLAALREGVEPVAAASAAVHASGEQISRLRELHEAMVDAVRHADAVSFARVDEEFHQSIVTASGNPLVEQLLQTLHAALHSRYSGRLPVFTDATDTSLRRHGELVDAIAARDPDGAESIARTLVREAREEIFRSETDRA